MILRKQLYFSLGLQSLASAICPGVQCPLHIYVEVMYFPTLDFTVCSLIKMQNMCISTKVESHYTLNFSPLLFRLYA